MADQPVTNPLPVGFKRDGTPQRRSNGFIAARRKVREQLDVESMRKRIKVGNLLARLYKAGRGKLDLSSNQIQAIKLLLDKAMPTLQAVETSYSEPAVERSEPELVAELKRVFDSSPGLLDQIIAERAQANPGVVEVQQTLPKVA